MPVPTTKQYRLTYVIDIYATSPLDAALQAEGIMKDQAESFHTGPFFSVYNVTDGKAEGDVDLEPYYIENGEDLEEEENLLTRGGVLII
jgi:hypothetical protein